MAVRLLGAGRPGDLEVTEAGRNELDLSLAFRE
jgi:hypothetical protein